jgi:hypothetical protein
MFAFAEKSIICLALVCSFPLFFLDKEFLGFRRFAWLVAFCTGLCVTLILDPNEELAQVLDKVTMAAVSITLVPHLSQLVKDNFWLGIGVVPPFFLVVHLSLETRVDSIDFWKLRCFLHMALFLPYLNHLNKDPPPTEDNTEPLENETDQKAKGPAEKSTSSGKKTRTNKKK